MNGILLLSKTMFNLNMSNQSFTYFKYWTANSSICSS
jgi:hypothetical protein